MLEIKRRQGLTAALCLEVILVGGFSGDHCGGKSKNKKNFSADDTVWCALSERGQLRSSGSRDCRRSPITRVICKNKELDGAGPQLSFFILPEPSGSTRKALVTVGSLLETMI